MRRISDLERDLAQIREKYGDLPMFFDPENTGQYFSAGVYIDILDEHDTSLNTESLEGPELACIIGDWGGDVNELALKNKLNDLVASFERRLEEVKRSVINPAKKYWQEAVARAERNLQAAKDLAAKESGT